MSVRSQSCCRLSLRILDTDTIFVPVSPHSAIERISCIQPAIFNRTPAGVGSYGGYSADPRTRQLKIRADKYRPRGW
jgi:hypothetical protein